MGGWDVRDRSIVTRELGFESLEEMQQARAAEVPQAAMLLFFFGSFIHIFFRLRSWSGTVGQARSLSL
jgi:hypothetical protein